MPLFTWSDNYTIGNDEIDTQHRYLFEIFNRLYDGCCQPGSTYDVYETLDELIDYAAFHFKTEHEYMLAIGYPHIETQINEHAYFTNEVLRLVQSRSMNSSELAKETITFLGSWLLHHVTEEDRKIIASQSAAG